MDFYLGTTDWDWFAFHSERKSSPVNFWRPGGTAFKRIGRGAPFLLKLKGKSNAIAGIGFFSGYYKMPLSLSWKTFGTSNGISMKKALIFASLLFSFLFSRAQVVIPDPNFAAYLQSNFPACMSGAVLDTTCAAITTASILNCAYSNISDLTGIQYFDNLQVLDCSYNSLSALPPLPPNLINLMVDNNNISILTVFPEGIQNIEINNNFLTTLPPIPDSLEYLSCSNNLLTSLPSLNNLKGLICNGNQISSIPSLPAVMTSLACSENQLAALPALPGFLEVLICSGNLISSLPTLPIALVELNCVNNLLTSLPTLPGNLQWLFCDFNSLTSLPTLPSFLEELECGFCQLSAIPALPPSLIHLICPENQITTLPVIPGSLLVLDCRGNLLANLPGLPPQMVHLDCSSNLLTALPTLPADLSWLYCENNMITEMPTLPTSFLIKINCGNNLFDSLPALPGTLSELICDSNQLTFLPTLPPNLLYLHCNFNQLDSLPALPSTLMGLDIENNFFPTLPILPAGLMALSCGDNFISCFPEFSTGINQINLIPNPFSCLTNYIFSMDSTLLAYPICVGTCYDAGINGMVYNDANTDCLKDSTEGGFANIHLTVNDGSGVPLAQAYSSTTGNFHAQLLAGTYTVVVDTTDLPLTVQCPFPGTDTTITISPGDTGATQILFGLGCEGVDLGVMAIASTGLIFPGQEFLLNIRAGDLSQWNNAQCASGTGGLVVISVDGPVNYVSPVPGALTPISVSGNVFTYNIPDFGAIDFYTAFHLKFLTLTTATSLDTVCVNVDISPTADLNPANNHLVFCSGVLNSLDPNMKEVFPVKVLAGFMDYFTYTIHFQNVGTAPAINIRLEDRLDGNLDLNTFKFLGSSHLCNLILLGDSLFVNFPLIYLADSTSNEPNSHGYFQFKIKPKPDLPAGTLIQNTANIFFDYNPPIFTNTTLNLLGSPDGLLESTAKSGPDVIVFPNPAANKISITGLPLQPGSISIYNLLGELILNAHTSGKPRVDLDLPAQTHGLHLIRIENPDGTVIRKVMVSGQ